VGLVSPVGLVLQSLGRWLHFAGFALGFGSAVYALFVAKDPRPSRIAGAGIALLLVAEPLALLAQTASLDPTQTFDGDALTGALASSFGRVLGLRVAAALLLWAVLGALRQAPWLRWAIPVLGLALAIVDATAAHATPALPQPRRLNRAARGRCGWRRVGFARVALRGSGGVRVGGPAARERGVGALHLASPLDLLTTAYGGS
jgi:hypothetical protein